MKMTTTKTLPTTGCWIHEDNRYRCTLNLGQDLPCIDAKYEGILKFYKIPYWKFEKQKKDYWGKVSSNEVCEYWNPKVHAEKEVSLPLYARMPDFSYYYCRKNYSATIPTSDTIEAAKETQRFVEEQIEEYEQVLQEVELYMLAKNAIGDGLTKMHYSNQLASRAEHHLLPLEFYRKIRYMGCVVDVDKYNYFPYYSYDINMNNELYKIIRLNIKTNWVAIFNMNKIVPNGHIHLMVPEQIAGLVIGSDHINIQAWAKIIGVKEIHVVPI